MHLAGGVEHGARFHRQFIGLHIALDAGGFFDAEQIFNFQIAGNNAHNFGIAHLNGAVEHTLFAHHQFAGGNQCTFKTPVNAEIFFGVNFTGYLGADSQPVGLFGSRSVAAGCFLLVFCEHGLCCLSVWLIANVCNFRVK